MIPLLSIHLIGIGIGIGIVKQCIKAESEHKGAINEPAGYINSRQKKDPASAGPHRIKLTVRSLLATEPAEYYRATGAIRGPLHCRASSKY